jgi:hypothetical protein
VKTRISLTVLLALLVSLIVGRVSVAAPERSNGGPPGPWAYFYTIPASEGCGDFDVELRAVSGTTKTLDFRSGKSMWLTPGGRGTATRADNPQKSVELVTTGQIRFFPPDRDGNTVAVGNGRNMNWGPGIGVWLIMGTFTWTYDANGALISADGHVRQVDVCAMLG